METNLFGTTAEPEKAPDIIELGKTAEETKGGGGQNVLDGGTGWWF